MLFPVFLDTNDVLWVNDSKATNVESTYAGLKGLAQRRAVVLLGGVAKVYSNITCYFSCFALLENTSKLFSDVGSV
jgi:UDP-N-acetylmuramoylalanine-D-glutamate ligase